MNKDKISDFVSNLNLNELDEVIALATAEIAKKEKQHKAEGIEKLQALMAEYDIDELPAAKKRKASKVAPKYQNPNNKSETWTGRGRKPKWVEAALNDGSTLESLKIK